MTLAHFKCKYFSQVSNLTWFCLLAICLQRFRHFSFPWLYMGLALSRILFESLILKSFMAETASYGQNYSELVMQSNKRRYLLFLSKINNVSKTAIYCWLKLLQPTADANFHKSPARGNLPNFPSAPNFNKSCFHVCYSYFFLSCVACVFVLLFLCFCSCLFHKFSIIKCQAFTDVNLRLWFFVIWVYFFWEIWRVEDDLGNMELTDFLFWTVKFNSVALFCLAELLQYTKNEVCH